MKYKDLLTQWMNEKQFYKLKHRTYLRYEELIKSQILSELGNFEITDLTVQLIRNFQR